MLISIIDGEELLFSEHLACVHCGISLGEIEPRTFSFNNPHGACPTCTGLGFRHEIDPDLVLNKELSVMEGALRPWQSHNWYLYRVGPMARRHGFSLDNPISSENPSQPSQPSRSGTEPRCEGFSEGVDENRKPSQVSVSESVQIREGFPSDKEPSRDFEANREGSDSCEGFIKGTEERLGMTVEQAPGIWTAEGKPVINLGSGENCLDLEKLLSHRNINERHLAAVRAWLEKR